MVATRLRRVESGVWNPVRGRGNDALPKTQSLRLFVRREKIGPGNLVPITLLVEKF